ncbi:MAG: JAB domain-containing protein [Bacteroidales bacterium]
MKTFKSNCPEIELKLKRGEVKKMKIVTSKDAFTALKLFFDQDTIELTETFIALFLNRSNNTIGWLKVSTGGITGTTADVRIILATALKTAATSLILAHNHPSGNLRPSDCDITLTKKIKTAALTMDIIVIDHVIVTEESYFSFADEGML